MPRTKKTFQDKIEEAGIFMLASQKNKFDLKEIDRYASKLTPKIWNKIILNQKLTAEFFDKYSNKIDWKDKNIYLSNRQIFTEEIIEKCKDLIDWDHMTFLDENLVNKFNKYIDLEHYQFDKYRNNSELKLSREFLDKYKDVLSWKDVSYYVSSKDFWEFRNLLDWNSVDYFYLEENELSKLETFIDFFRYFKTTIKEIYSNFRHQETKYTYKYISFDTLLKYAKYCTPDGWNRLRITEEVFMKLYDICLQANTVPSINHQIFATNVELSEKFISFLETIYLNNNKTPLSRGTFYAILLDNANLSEITIDRIIKENILPVNIMFGKIFGTLKKSLKFITKYEKYYDIYVWRRIETNQSISKEYYMEHSEKINFEVLDKELNSWITTEMDDSLKLFLLVKGIVLKE